MSEPQQRLSSFEEFWPYYVSQHMDPTCRALHFVGTSLALGCAALTPFYPPALLAAPVAGYSLAWLGHFVFEKNRPATFTYPLWSLRGDFRMWRLTLARKMEAELERARAMFAEETADAN
ncbi:Mpo1-like protein [Haliangium sp.]|uniref:Mpo1-like protein n=1 Tax=Haliangium sp. TaxID=2663208 RepID=UPI003D14F05A